MTVTIVGRVADPLGHCQRTDAYIDPTNPRRVLSERRSFSLAPSRYRTVQSRIIPLDVEHGKIVGEVLTLELDRSGSLWATARSEVDDLLDAGPLFFSVDVTHDGHGDDIELRSLSLTEHPATVGALPVQLIPGTLRHAALEERSGPSGDRLRRALDAYRRRRPGDPIMIDGEAFAPITRSSTLDVEPPHGPIEFRVSTITRVGGRPVRDVTRSDWNTELLERRQAGVPLHA